MLVNTKSGSVSVNKNSHYGKFLIGYTSTDAWSGARTVECAWRFATMFKTPSISWQDLGKMVGEMIANNTLNEKVFMYL